MTSPSFHVQPCRSPDDVERVEHLAREGRGLFEHAIDDVGRLFEAGKLRDLVDSGELAQDELHVAQRGTIRCHRWQAFVQDPAGPRGEQRSSRVPPDVAARRFEPHPAPSPCSRRCAAVVVAAVDRHRAAAERPAAPVVDAAPPASRPPHPLRRPRRRRRTEARHRVPTVRRRSPTCRPARRRPSAPAVRRRSARNRAGPRLAIIVDDCGQWPDTERGFVALPIPVTLSVLPHVRYGATIARDGRRRGQGRDAAPADGDGVGPLSRSGRDHDDDGDAAIGAELRGDLADVAVSPRRQQPRGQPRHRRPAGDERRRRASSRATAASSSTRARRRPASPNRRARTRRAESRAAACSSTTSTTPSGGRSAPARGDRRRARDRQRDRDRPPARATLAAVRSSAPEPQADGVSSTSRATLVH